MAEFVLRLPDGSTPRGTGAYAHMTTARRYAEAAANGWDLPVTIGTMIGEEFKARIVINPDGTAAVPAGMNPPPGPEHAPNDNGVCFCLNCRAARR